MIPIHDLLSRIRWDTEFARGRFEIGYYDRRLDAIRRVAFREIVFPSGEGQAFEIVDEAGHVRRIPFHRVREVVRDGDVIWRRSPPGGPAHAIEQRRGGNSVR
jgi:uncharacterized protein (UPF0248 family)